MATIDIGKIKPVFKGTYDNSTAYVLDDIVYYNGSSYVAKTSTTGNLPTDTTKWNILASGSGGIWDSNLSIGSAGQVVKVSSGGALEFGTLASDCVKLATTTISSNVGDVQIQGYFDDTIYSHYILITAGLSTTNDSNNSDVYYRMQTESGGSYSDYTSSNYYELRNSVTGTSGGTTGGQSGRLHATSYANFSHNNLEADIGRGMTSFMYIWMPDTSGFSFRARNFTFSFHGATANYYSADVSHHIDDNGVQFKGIKIYPSGGNFDAGRFTLYGFKK